MSRKSFTDMRFDDEVIDEGSEHISEEDGEHHAFRECGVDDANEDTHDADKESVSPSPFVCHGGGDGFCNHEYESEHESS